MATITIAGRRCGKTFAAAQAAGMSMDDYRARMKRMHEDLEAAKARHVEDACRADFPRVWAEIDRQRLDNGPARFLQEYTLDFSEPPEPVVVEIPIRDDWLRRWMTRDR